MQWKAVSLTIIILNLVSCGLPLSSQEAENTEAKPKPSPIAREEVMGRVASIDLEDRFVLIELFVGREKLERGSLLRSYGSDGSTARLKLSGETMGSFAVADILSGRVEKNAGVRFMVKAQAPGFFDEEEKIPNPQISPKKTRGD